MLMCIIHHSFIHIEGLIHLSIIQVHWLVNLYLIIFAPFKGQVLLIKCVSQFIMQSRKKGGLAGCLSG